MEISDQTLVDALAALVEYNNGVLEISYDLLDNLKEGIRLECYDYPDDRCIRFVIDKSTTDFVS
jgi:hypothetical protein